MIRWYELPIAAPIIALAFVYGFARGLYRLWHRA